MNRIFTVDDSPSIRQMVAVRLTGAGFTVVQAVDDVDGPAREKETSARTPILALTTETGDDMKAKGKALLGVVKKVIG